MATTSARSTALIRFLRFAALTVALAPAIFSQTTPLPNLPVIPMGELADRPFRHEPEKLLFNITYLGILGGYATMDATPGTNAAGERTMQFEMKAWTTPFVSAFYRLMMTLTADVHPENLKTFYYVENRLEKERRFFHIMDFFPEGKNYKYGFMYEGRTNYDTILSPEKNHDVVTSFYVARCLDLSRTNVKYGGNVYYHKDRFTFEVWVTGKKQINTPWGKMDTIVIVPKMKFRGIFLNTGDIVIYLSDDEYLCPVLMESQISVGYFKASLTKGYPGKKK